MRNEIIVSFGIFDFNDITHNEITGILGGIQPNKTYVKGEKRNPKRMDSPVINKNSWILDSGLSKYSSFEDQIGALLSIVEPNIDRFKPLCNKYYCEISCALFIYPNNGESTPWVHLDARYNRLIRELNIEFDIDLYVSAEEEAVDRQPKLEVR